MSKSKYPNQIDTSAELPTVRDNITELGGDALNSFKSAIIALEKTLGINPQGSAGNTVATRLNKIMDSNGNLLESAITKVGIVTGPITNNEVSTSAAISESKINLNFPTKILQDEISMLQADLDSFEQSLREVMSAFAVHVNPASLNRHFATSIDVVAASSTPSNIASLDLSEQSLQGAIEEIYNSHINYSGLNISLTNNSHTASQIYFDNSDVEDVTISSSVQDALEDLANIATVGLVDSILNLSSNGIIRRGSIIDEFEANQRASLLVAASAVTYTQAEGASRTSIIFSETPTPIDTISPFDILELTGSVEDSDNKDYRISNVTLSGGDIVSIEIFGGPTTDPAGSLIATVYKNPFVIYNPVGLSSAVRPRINKTSTPDIQLANPNSATVISTQITPEAITSTAHTFSISIDGAASVLIDTYDSNVLNQTIDSIINKVNEQVVDNKYNFLAYKYRANNCYEMAIAHNIPNISTDTSNRTITLSVGTSNDGSGILGLTDLLGITTEGTSGNSFLINGTVYSSFGNFKKYTGANLELTSGTQGLTIVGTTFAEEEIRVGDLIIIEGSSVPTDDGTYRISSTLDDTAEVDGTYLFSGALDSSSLVYISRTTAPIGELIFEEILSVTGSILFDVFADDNADIFYNKRLEVDGEPKSGSFLGTITDISKGFIVGGETGTLNINVDGTAHIIGPDGNPGEAKYISSPGDYKLFASDGFSFITIRVGTAGVPSNTISLTIYGFNEIARGSFALSRGVFSTSLGRVLGYPTEPGVPALIDKRRSGTVDESIISESLIEKYIQGPRNDLRGSGIIRGLEVSNVQLFSGYQTFDISAGVAVVNGIRIEYPGKLGNRINSENDFYIAIDPYGCIITADSVINPDGYTIDNQGLLSPFYDKEVADLASSESQIIFDMRLFVDKIDLKITKEIIVSNEKHLGHFTSIPAGIEYAKRFSDLFPDAGTPIVHIREGLYEISEAIIIDFDLVVKGSGAGTVLTKSSSFAFGSGLLSTFSSPLDSVFYLGNTTSNQSPDILYGITIKDFVYRNDPGPGGNVGNFISIAEAENIALNRVFLIENIIANGPSTMAYNGGADIDVIGEYFLNVGFADTGTYTPTADTYGFIIVKNCIMNSMGAEYGPCRLKDASSNIFKNIIATNNIGTNLSPNEAATTFEIFEPVSTATLSNVIEISNIITL